ncbi:MAG: polysaccharide deacetylase family protein [Treponema sp.]|nr:polysaccharide deacetylase family protein [Treponema sp.]MCL2272634.1 polysaccharide deacetylase family protein [Treponema sp.]
MKEKKIPAFLLVLLFPVFLLQSVSFSGLNLLSDDRLLYRVDSGDQHAIFITALADMSFQQLTAFPEKLQLIDNGRTVLAVNRFGAARIPVSGGLPSPLPGYPSFAAKNTPLPGDLQKLEVSFDGRWVLYVEPTSTAYGNLLLIDTANGVKKTISERVELPAADFPAKWHPDSRYFIYCKDGRLYYFPIISDLSVLVDERFRMLGAGGINSITWGSFGDFYFLTGTTLYRINNHELFTRTVYGDFLSIGEVSAVIPVEFNPTLDRYWISPDSRSVLVNKNDKSFFVFPSGFQDAAFSNLPFIMIPHGTEKINVLWSSSGILAITAMHKNKTIAWRFEITGNSTRNLNSANVPASSAGLLSPDGTKAVFWSGSGLELWDFINWRQIQKLKNEQIFSCAWINNNNIVSGSERFIESVNISDPGYQSRRLCLSGITEEFGFGISQIFARTGNEWFSTDGQNQWTSADNPQLRTVSLSSERYRVFLEPQNAGYYINVPVIRSAVSSNTTTLVSGHSVNGAYDSSASRLPGRQTQIALCFDLYDDDTGLLQTLAALKKRNIKATFFLNGDFIRRHPLAAAAIAEAGHETASLFYAPIDFSDTRYRIAGDFIAGGLARNEDEFFHATGSELSPLWHPPFFRSSSLITSAAAAAGYATITRTIDPGDWLSREEAVRLSLRQISPSQMIEQIIQKKSSDAVIPVRLGALSGGRDEYLFQRIDVLLDALIRSGCKIIPVSEVIRK